MYLAFLLFNKLVIYKSAPLWQKLAPYTLLGNMQILRLMTFASALWANTSGDGYQSDIWTRR
jgi:hypothetical protein